MGVWRGRSYGYRNGGNADDRRGMGVSSCQNIAVDIDVSGFGSALMMERISRQRQVLQLSDRERESRLRQVISVGTKGMGRNGRR